MSSDDESHDGEVNQTTPERRRAQDAAGLDIAINGEAADKGKQFMKYTVEKNAKASEAKLRHKDLEKMQAFHQEP